MALGVGAVGGSAVTAFDQADAARYAALTVVTDAPKVPVLGRICLPALHVVSASCQYTCEVSTPLPDMPAVLKALRTFHHGSCSAGQHGEVALHGADLYSPALHSFEGAAPLLKPSCCAQQALPAPGQQANGIHPPAASAPASYPALLPPEHIGQQTEEPAGDEQNGHATADQGPPVPAGVSPRDLAIASDLTCLFN